jgi:hypothetical protein
MATEPTEHRDVGKQAFESYGCWRPFESYDSHGGQRDNVRLEPKQKQSKSVKNTPKTSQAEKAQKQPAPANSIIKTMRLGGFAIN